MTDRCPHCGQTMPDREPTIEKLRRWCIDNRHHVWPDDTVSKETAAEITGFTVKTLSNRRAEGRDPPFHKHSQTAPVRYYLTGLAAMLDKKPPRSA